VGEQSDDRRGGRFSMVRSEGLETEKESRLVVPDSEGQMVKVISR